MSSGLSGELRAALRRRLPQRLRAPLRRVVTRLLGPKMLYMMRPDLEALPEVRLPAGYGLDCVRPGREEAYLEVMRSSIDAGADRAWYRENFLDDPSYDPSYLLLVLREGRPVAAAAAWHSTWDGGPIGLIHNVGVITEELGRGLGRAATVAALRRLRERGFGRALLATEESRMPAIGLYLSLGFAPLPRGPVHRWRWRAVRRRLGRRA